MTTSLRLGKHVAIAGFYEISKAHPEKLLSNHACNCLLQLLSKKNC
jgi:hypothetical protein